MARSPFVPVLNKADLADAWRLEDAQLVPLLRPGQPPIRSSALSGEGVESAFQRRAAATLG
jgi:hypothetical protein